MEGLRSHDAVCGRIDQCEERDVQVVRWYPQCSAPIRIINPLEAAPQYWWSFAWNLPSLTETL